MKFNWQKNKMDLNIRKITNHPPSPGKEDKKKNVLTAYHHLIKIQCNKNMVLFY